MFVQDIFELIDVILTIDFPILQLRHVSWKGAFIGEDEFNFAAWPKQPKYINISKKVRKRYHMFH